MTEVFHVVCRDCTMERLTESRTAAEEARSSHERALAHRVAVGRVDALSDRAPTSG